jgi:hypothetical protein
MYRHSLYHRRQQRLDHDKSPRYSAGTKARVGSTCSTSRPTPQERTVQHRHLTENSKPSRSRRTRLSTYPALCPSTTRAPPSRATPRQRVSTCRTGSSSTPWRHRRLCTSTSSSTSLAPLATDSSGSNTMYSHPPPRDHVPATDFKPLKIAKPRRYICNFGCDKTGHESNREYDS